MSVTQKIGRLISVIYKISPLPKKVIVEIGAYDGNDDFISQCHERGYSLYLFEPNRLLYSSIKEKLSKYNSSNLHVFNTAVSDYNGQGKFYLSNCDYCSSLNKFSKEVNEKWGKDSRSLRINGFRTIKEVTVNVTRLDTFMLRNSLDHIDFLEIDAQGEDYKIIRSLGNKINRCDKIQIEVSTKDPQYQKQVGKSKVVEYMNENGFVICKIAQQSFGKEENITFKQKDNLMAFLSDPLKKLQAFTNNICHYRH